MAEGWFNHYSREWGHIQVPAYSANILTRKIHPCAISVMKERNIDISHHLTKSLFTIPMNHITYFITVCDQAQNVYPLSLPEGTYAIGTYLI